MKRRLLLLYVLIHMLCFSVSAEPIKWVDFGVPYESLKYAMDTDISTAGQEKHLDWIEILTVAGCRTGGKCPLIGV